MRSIYKGYNSLPVFNFYEIIRSNNLAWFIKGYDDDPIELTEKETISYTELFHKIYEESLAYLGNVKSEQHFKKLAEIDSLETKIVRVSNTCKIIANIPLTSKWFVKFVDDLKEEGFKYTKPITTEEEKLTYFKYLESRLKGERNKLNIKKIQYKDVLPNEKKKKKPIDLVKNKIILEEILAPKSIDLRTMPLKEWDALCKRADEKVKQLKTK